jgi:hypothetical protein
MAVATKQSETTETIKSVTLELTLEEVRTLAVVYSRVGGGQQSPGRHVSSVIGALAGVGIDYQTTPEQDLYPHKSLYFSDYPVEG